VSGKQRGVDDDRYIWPEMLRIIEESGPSWVVIENSDNVLRMAFGQIATDLETAGYQVGEPLIIPACAVNADHRRNRAWICAHADKIGLQGGGEKQIQGIASLPGILAGVLETDRSRQSISEPRMLRGYNGLPGWMDRIKALGNAVVPQIPEIIGRAIIHVSQEQP
jgi:DNA (cytosine-5)-methyltransferase 1